jgi:GT2 family glycosyltransferase
MANRKEANRVSVIVPVYNRSRFVEQCLTSVLSMNYGDFEVIVVDDASTDDSVELIKKSFGHDPRLSIIQLPTHSGAAAARNAGVVKSNGKYLAFLDSDVEVTQNWLRELVEGLQSDSTIGAVQSKIFYMSDRTRLQCVGMRIIPYLGLIVNIGGDRIDDGSCDNVRDICASTHMIVDREVINRVGLFDPKLFTCWEEVDFSWRVWLGGYKQTFAPKAVEYHAISPPTPRKRRSIEFYLNRNPFRVILKNYSVKNLIKYFPLSVIGMFFRDLVILQKTKDYYPMLSLIRGIMWNLEQLSDTLKERYIIQRLIRRVPDEYIMEHIMVNMSPFHIFRKYFAGEEIVL